MITIPKFNERNAPGASVIFHNVINLPPEYGYMNDVM